MTDISLPALAATAAPEFNNEESAKAWLGNVPLANIAAAQRQLLAQLKEFNRFQAPGAVRFAVLEALREAVGFVQSEQAKRFTNRALPMTEGESAVLGDTIALWEQMRLGYLRCVAGAAKRESGMRAHAAAACQRALAFSGLKMFHYFRAYRQVRKGEWQALHEVYAIAEKLGVAEHAVKDYMNRYVHDTSPRIAYVRALLMGMANPNELSQRQLTFITYLLERWAEKVEVAQKPVAGEEAPPLVADLAGDACSERTAVDALEPRFLDCSRLAKSLRNRIALLRKGESPAKLGLGEDCVQPSCEHLLVFLYRQWCQLRAARAGERRRVSEIAQVCNEIAAIHYYVSGRAFRQPGGRTELTKKQREEIATFGRVSTRDEDDYSRAHGFLLEHWQIDDESLQGLKVVRRAGNPGKRYAHGQLIGVRPADAKSFMLGQVRWLAQGENGDLFAGVRLLPGLPVAVAVRSGGLNAPNEPFVQALSLTAVAALNAPPTLVLPSGWYRPRRVIDVHVESTTVQARLLEILERGSDYERLSYEMVS